MDNPLATDGFELVEFTGPDPQANFKAPFESLELDQVRRGVLGPDRHA